MVWRKFLPHPGCWLVHIGSSNTIGKVSRNGDFNISKGTVHCTLFRLQTGPLEVRYFRNYFLSLFTSTRSKGTVTMYTNC